MNILILNGTPDLFHTDFERHLEKYKTMLHHLGYYVRIFQLNQIMNEQIPDEETPFPAYGYIARAIGDADLVLFASPLINGKMSDLILKMYKALSDDRSYNNNPLRAMITLGEDCEHIGLPGELLMRSHPGYVMIKGRTHTEAVFETIRNIRTQKAVSEFAS